MNCLPSYRITVSIAFLVVLLAAGCGGGGNGSLVATPAQQAGPTQNESGPNDATTIPCLPGDPYIDPEEILARRGSWAEISTITGDKCFVSSANTEIEVDAHRLRLDPAGAPAGAWAAYRFDDLVSEDLPVTIGVELEPGVYPEELYIGVGDFTGVSWHWLQFTTPANRNTISIPEYINLINPGGNAYFTVMALGSEVVYLNSVTLGTVQDLNAVNGFTASDATDNDRVHLTWDRPAQADGYIIEYHGMSGMEPIDWTPLATIEGEWNLEYDHLLNGDPPAMRFTKYEYRVKARLGEKTSRSWSVDSGLLGYTVQNFSASDGESVDKIVLRWDPIPDCEGYRIESTTSSEFSIFVTLNDSSVDEIAYPHSEPGVIEIFRICPIWNETVTHYWSIDTGYCGPYIHENVTEFSASQNLPDTIRLSWIPDLSFDGYQLEYRIIQNGTATQWLVLAEIDDAQTAGFDHTTSYPFGYTVYPGWLYEYRIKAWLGNKLSLVGETCLGYCGDRIPEDVTGFYATTMQPDQVTLYWSKDQLDYEYYVEYICLSGGHPRNWTELNTTSGTALNHTTDSPPGHELDQSSAYVYRIKAIGNGNLSKNWAYTTGYCSGVSVFNASDGTYPDQVLLTWGYTAGVDSVAIEYRNADGGTPEDWILLDTFTGTDTQELIHSPTSPAELGSVSGTLYEYRIRAVLGGIPLYSIGQDYGYFGPVGPGTWPMVGGNRRHTRSSSEPVPGNVDLAWEYAGLGDGIARGEAVVDDKGNLYIVTSLGLVSISRDGDQRWLVPVSTHSYQVTSPLVTQDGLIVVLTDNVGATAYDSNGENQWTYTCVTGFGSPVQSADGTILFCNGSKLVALNPDGTRGWTYSIEGCHYATPAVADDGTVYVATQTGYLYAVSPAGELLWDYELTQQTSGVTSPAITNFGMVVVGVNDGTVHAINPDGSQGWVRSVGAGELTAPSIYPFGDIYISTNGVDSYLYSLTRTGTIRWIRPWDQATSAVVVDNESTLHFTCDDGYLYVLSPNGDTVRQIEAGPNYAAPIIAMGYLITDSYHWGLRLRAYGVVH